MNKRHFIKASATSIGGFLVLSQFPFLAHAVPPTNEHTIPLSLTLTVKLTNEHIEGMLLSLIDTVKENAQYNGMTNLISYSSPDKFYQLEISKIKKYGALDVTVIGNEKGVIDSNLHYIPIAIVVEQLDKDRTYRAYIDTGAIVKDFKGNRIIRHGIINPLGTLDQYLEVRGIPKWVNIVLYPDMIWFERNVHPHGHTPELGDKTEIAFSRNLQIRMQASELEDALLKTKKQLTSAEQLQYIHLCKTIIDYFN